MNFYNKITFIENLNRKYKLNEFRNYVVEYFNNVTYDSHFSYIENEVSQKLRSKINMNLDEVDNIIALSGTPTVIRWTPPPMIGGYIQDIDIIRNIYNLTYYKISPQKIIDSIEISLGIYVRDFKFSILRTLNPFYWLDRILNYIASFPFYILEKFGMNKSVEGSSLGKFIKGIIYLFQVTWLIIQICNWINS